MIVTKAYREIIIGLLFLACVFILFFFVDPIAQDPLYHNFADKRPILGIPNFWDVASNIPFLFIGLYGFYMTKKIWESKPAFTVKWTALIFSIGVFSVCFGSSYYHLNPNNQTLVWDRLPMTLMFMSFFSLIIYDFMNQKAGQAFFLISIPLGIASVLYWHYTELIGLGDLRPYILVQFFPMAIAPFIIVFYYKKVRYTKLVVLLFFVTIFMKTAEYFDREIFNILPMFSGHTIKHFLGALSMMIVLKIMSVRHQTDTLYKSSKK